MTVSIAADEPEAPPGSDVVADSYPTVGVYVRPAAGASIHITVKNDENSRKHARVRGKYCRPAPWAEVKSRIRWYFTVDLVSWHSIVINGVVERYYQP